MKHTDSHAEFTTRLGSLLTRIETATVESEDTFGRFRCSIDKFADFGIIRRTFETRSNRFSVPFSRSEPALQMVFSLKGKSVFNERSNPYILYSGRHSLSFFNRYECSNLMDPRSHQQDIAFSLEKRFYADLLVGHYSNLHDKLPEMILREQTFNTLNNSLPNDSAILGILTNIIECPFTGEMREVYIGHHVRALLTLQLFHFSNISVDKAIKTSGKITRRDEEILHEVKAFLDSQFLEPSSLDVITRKFGINEFKLKKGFKEIFNTSPMRYLQNKRLEFSLILLRETDKTIKEIAGEIGYTHAANYATAFTKLYGSSPAHFRTARQVR